jgi:hypothetical protein
METKKSKVTAIAEKVSQFAGPNGTIYYHEISFENGDKGRYGSKTEKCEKFTVGQEADYTIETKVNGNYTNHIIKPVQVQNGPGGGFKQPKNEKLIVAQSSIGYAVEHLKHNQPADSESVLQLAEKFYNWACEKGGIK